MLTQHFLPYLDLIFNLRLLLSIQHWIFSLKLFITCELLSIEESVNKTYFYLYFLASPGYITILNSSCKLNKYNIKELLQQMARDVEVILSSDMKDKEKKGSWVTLGMIESHTHALSWQQNFIKIKFKNSTYPLKLKYRWTERHGTINLWISTLALLYSFS